MKCGVCGYEKRTTKVKTNKVIPYVSGKRKGEIKKVEEEYITIYENDPEFIQLVFEKDVDRLGTIDWEGFGEVGLLACPICGTVRVNGATLI